MLRQLRRLALRRDDRISARATPRRAGSARRRAAAAASAAASATKADSPKTRDEYAARDIGTDDAERPLPLKRNRRQRRATARRALPLTIEGELVAKSTGTVSDFAVGDRVFHQKFGNGNVTAIDGNKLTIAFDKAGEKRVVDSFVERV